MTLTAQLLPARWPKGPQICSIANLPAFESQAEMKDFHAVNAPRIQVKEEYQCFACGKWHAVSGKGAK
jgi:hypothetical protein